MNENIPIQNSVETEKETADRSRREYADLAREVSESHESFDFPGMDTDAYQKAKATDEEYPEYVVVPIDELVTRLSQGCKIVFGKDPGTVFIVPTTGDSDPDGNSLFPAQLAITEGMDEDLKKLVLAHKTRVAVYGK